MPRFIDYPQTHPLRGASRTLVIQGEIALQLQIEPDRFFAAEPLNARDVVFLNSNGRWQRADADAAAFTGLRSPFVGIAKTSAQAGGPVRVLVRGMSDDLGWNFSTADLGKPLYVPTVPGPPTTTPPTTAGSVVYLVGWVVETGAVMVDPLYVGRN
jgi:hypothetical protein